MAQWVKGSNGHAFEYIQRGNSIEIVDMGPKTDEEIRAHNQNEYNANINAVNNAKDLTPQEKTAAKTKIKSEQLDQSYVNSSPLDLGMEPVKAEGTLSDPLADNFLPGLRTGRSTGYGLESVLRYDPLKRMRDDARTYRQGYFTVNRYTGNEPLYPYPEGTKTGEELYREEMNDLLGRRREIEKDMSVPAAGDGADDWGVRDADVEIINGFPVVTYLPRLTDEERYQKRAKDYQEQYDAIMNDPTASQADKAAALRQLMLSQIPDYYLRKEYYDNLLQSGVDFETVVQQGRKDYYTRTYGEKPGFNPQSNRYIKERIQAGQPVDSVQYVLEQLQNGVSPEDISIPSYYYGANGGDDPEYAAKLRADFLKTLPVSDSTGRPVDYSYLPTPEQKTEVSIQEYVPLSEKQEAAVRQELQALANSNRIPADRKKGVGVIAQYGSPEVIWMINQFGVNNLFRNLDERDIVGKVAEKYTLDNNPNTISQRELLSLIAEAGDNADSISAFTSALTNLFNLPETVMNTAEQGRNNSRGFSMLEGGLTQRDVQAAEHPVATALGMVAGTVLETLLTGLGGIASGGGKAASVGARTLGNAGLREMAEKAAPVIMRGAVESIPNVIQDLTSGKSTEETLKNFGANTLFNASGGIINSKAAEKVADTLGDNAGVLGKYLAGFLGDAAENIVITPSRGIHEGQTGEQVASNMLINTINSLVGNAITVGGNEILRQRANKALDNILFGNAQDVPQQVKQQMILYNGEAKTESLIQNARDASQLADSAVQEIGFDVINHKKGGTQPLDAQSQQILKKVVLTGQAPSTEDMNYLQERYNSKALTLVNRAAKSRWMNK